MGFSDHIPSFTMSPPSFSKDTDAIEVRLQFPMNNEPLELYSPEDQPPSFKRARTCDNSHSNAMPYPPRMVQQPTVNKGTSHIFFKTRICAKFRIGACRNGENCNFAHGIEDMRQPPPNWQDLVGLHNEERQLPPSNWDDDEKIIHKMKLCKKYYNGEECSYGDKCSFLHEGPSKFRDDSGRFRESTAISIGTNGSPKSYNDATSVLESNKAANIGLNVPRGNGKPTYWRTKLCTKFEITGHCTYGDDCHFAHGQAGYVWCYYVIFCNVVVLASDLICKGILAMPFFCNVVAFVSDMICERSLLEQDTYYVFESELQVPGGRIEAETVGAIPNTAKAIIQTIPRTTPVSSNDALPSNRASVPPENEEQGKKHLLKWKGPKKINRIYGDWLDDLPFIAR
ncbi:hypothetical protein Fmac_012790 [Flemingia macrophylla]|uniref:C3H1-type domain-containing protein n=1 Tax=Flemingia macrophylla TaxID=520843 RepID=A0ABD1MRA6_9FABA